MGSGKTTLGLLLSESLAYPFVDLDSEVERAAGCSIRDLIEEHGEPAFRRQEMAALQDVMPLVESDCVVATGGGIVETAEAAAALRQFGTVVWLRADPQQCVARLAAQGAKRPLLDDEAEWQRRWRQRLPLYKALADVSIDTDSGSAADSLATLLLQLGDSKA